MKIKLIILLLLSIVACNNAEKKKNNSEIAQVKKNNTFDFGVWIEAKKEKSNEYYAKEFQKYSDAGIDQVLINTVADPVLLSRLVPLAKDKGLKVHAWVKMMNRAGDTTALKHPDWYMVSREGKSCYDTRPYVDYYQWLCPTRKASRNHVLSLVKGLAKVEGIASIHLDYIRFPDVFLPIGLLPKYHLKQDTEMAAYDFCYCDVCIAAFEKLHHRDPRKSKNPALDIEWKNFRLNAIKAVVDDAYKIAHKNGKKLTAAVFPYPEMADHMVRQRWDKWDIDEVFPMIYNVFYNEGIDWIGYATKQDVEDVKGRGIGINTGVYIPGLKSSKELKQAILLAKSNGAKGVTFFDGPALTQAYLKTIKKVKESLQ